MTASGLTCRFAGMAGWPPVLPAPPSGDGRLGSDRDRVCLWARRRRKEDPPDMTGIRFDVAFSAATARGEASGRRSLWGQAETAVGAARPRRDRR